jgi:hypothetical protein
LMLRKISRPSMDAVIMDASVAQINEEHITKLASSQWTTVGELDALLAANNNTVNTASPTATTAIMVINETLLKDANDMASIIGEGSCLIQKVYEMKQSMDLSRVSSVIILHHQATLASESSALLQKELRDLMEVMVSIMKVKDLQSLFFVSIADESINASADMSFSDNLVGPILCSGWEQSFKAVKVLYCSRSCLSSKLLMNCCSVLESIPGVEFALQWQNDKVSLTRRSFVPFEVIPDNANNHHGGYEVVLKDRGSLDMLNISKTSKIAPESCKLETNEVLVRVAYVGINFRDVLNVLGMYPGNPGDPGCEFAGIVEAIGPLDESCLSSINGSLRVGDRVMGFHEGSLRTHIKVNIHCLCKAPNAIPLSLASTIPIVFCTVHHALKQ